jgi:hypothetical protein
MFKDKTVIELGAGAGYRFSVHKYLIEVSGLPGIFTSHFAKHVIVTDGDDKVVTVMKYNVQINHRGNLAT